MNYSMNVKITAKDHEILRNFLNHIHDESVEREFNHVKVEELDSSITVTLDKKENNTVLRKKHA